MRRTVNLVCVKDGWILERIAQRLADNLDYINWTEEPNGSHPITYYINYHQASDQKSSPIECAMFTHIEERNPELVEKWWRYANIQDVAVHMAEKYAKQFTHKVKAVPVLIPPGVDLSLYKPKLLRVGVVGSVKPETGRKGEELIRGVTDIDGIEWVFIGKGWPGKTKYLSEEEMPNMYRTLDYLLIPSLFEGGPMSAIEALACNIPIISPDVGWVPELPHIPYKKGEIKSLRSVLLGIVSNRNKLRAAVESRTWDNYIEEHDKLFRELLKIDTRSFTKKDIKKAVKKAKTLSRSSEVRRD